MSTIQGNAELVFEGLDTRPSLDFTDLDFRPSLDFTEILRRVAEETEAVRGIYVGMVETIDEHFIHQRCDDGTKVFHHANFFAHPPRPGRRAVIVYDGERRASAWILQPSEPPPVCMPLKCAA